MNVELPSFRLDDRLAVVTGASEGIGRVIARAFSAAGADVVLFSRRKEKLDELAAEIGEGGGSACCRASSLGVMPSRRIWSGPPCFWRAPLRIL
jgi:7-alpha-hydroxysteroid dehydrogenase